MKRYLTYCFTVFFISNSIAAIAFAAKHIPKESSNQQISYTLGYSTGKQISQSMASQKADLDQKQFATGITDAITGNKPRYSIEQMKKIIRKFQDDMLFESQQQAQIATHENRDQLVNNKFSPVDGNPKGTITLIEFFDPQCVHCRHLVPTLTQLKKQNPNLRIVYKEFPIFGEKSIFAAKAALAAHKQGKYQAMHHALMTSDKPLSKEQVLALAKQVKLNVKQLQKDMNDSAVEQELQHNRQLAQALGINATPGMIITTTTPLPNAPKQPKTMDDLVAVFIPGAVPIEMLQQTVDKLQDKMSATSSKKSDKK